MGGGGLLIFYVTNVACYKSELKVSYSRRGRLRTRTKCILVHFVPDFPVQKRYLCTEFQSALKLQTSN